MARERLGSRRDRPAAPLSPACFGPASTIFVSIASYRDPQLEPTIADCLAKARFPDRLRLGVCWQHGPEEPAPELFADARFRVLDVDWRDSRGACWARAEVMKLWRGEDWFLQLDSHHRFAPDWDVILQDEAAATGSAKPLLTTYAPSYSPGDPDTLGEGVMAMAFNYFCDEGLALFKPTPIADATLAKGPARARFVSAHFLFAPGRFVEEVPYDPELYFIGEEITLTVRAFTQGYDLFHPSQNVVWHEYTRVGRNKHWDDHAPGAEVRQSWDKLDRPSRARARQLLLEPHTGTFGCGEARTVADYEAYAGLSFAHCKVQDYTRLGGFPPNPPHPPDWADLTLDRRVWMVLDASRLPAAALEDPLFWYVAIFDAEGRELLRQDADEAEIRQLVAGAPAQITLCRRFQSMSAPASWRVRPHSKSLGWLDVTFSGRIEASGPNPRAVPGLALTEVDDGFLVSRPDGAGPRHLLNRTGALLLEFANGRHSLTEIVEAVRELYGLPEAPEGDIVAFFERASRDGLIEGLAHA